MESNGNPNAIPADLGSASASLNEPPSNAPNVRNSPPPQFSAGDLFLVHSLASSSLRAPLPLSRCDPFFAPTYNDGPFYPSEPSPLRSGILGVVFAGSGVDPDYQRLVSGRLSPLLGGALTVSVIDFLLLYTTVKSFGCRVVSDSASNYRYAFKVSACDVSW